MPTAIIFDMDGVLINSESYLQDLEIETLKYFGLDLTPETADEYFGLRYEDYFTILIQKYQLQTDVKTILKKFFEVAEKYYAEVFEAMPSAQEVLKELQNKKYHLGLATGSPKKLAQAALKHHDLLSFFEAATYSEEVKAGKPDPEPFLLTAKKLQIPSAEIIVIEDSPNGFKSAKSAGMHLIAYKSKHNKNQDFSLADKIIENLKEIPSYIASL